MSLASETFKALKELKENATFTLWQIGKVLYEAEFKGLSFKTFFEEYGEELGISYKRGMAFKVWYAESFKNPVLDVKKLGVEKTLALIEPRKVDSEEFLKSFVKQYPQEKLEAMPVTDVREAAGSFVESHGGPSRAEKFFVQAADSLREALGLFEGAISGKYREGYASWPGKDNVFKLYERLGAVLRGLK